ncbi:MAG TPA: DUF6056 family protein, partial [Kofleriaceae bacterium]|nr:DUF6056 family protein [Kofleriaceae bacterium]
ATDAMRPAVKGVLAWTVAVVPMWIVLILCTHWEPVAHDGWGHWSWHRTIGMSFDHLLDFAKGTYVHNNPRLGQVLTLLIYTPGPYHAIVTPIVELSMFYLLAVLVLGRWPSLKRADDALLFATIFAMAALTVPSFGLMLFYRPFTGNYLYGLVINLMLLVPYRFHYANPAPKGLTANLWRAPLMLVLGLAAGLCNEHTGPALAGLIVLALVVFYRKDTRSAVRRIASLAWGIAGLVGLVAGGIALFKAPGQAIRYNGLANEHGTLGRIVERGAYANGRIIGVALLYCLPLVLWLGIGLVARWRSRPPAQPREQAVIQLVLAGLSLSITLTLLASPKQGPRLYLASVVIACAALAGWMLAQCVARWARAVTAALATVVLAYMTWRCIPTYRTLGREFRERVAILDAAPDNSVADIPIYSIHRTRWSVGDDLLIEKLRNGVSANFGLALVRMYRRGHLEDTTAPVPPPDEP